MEIGEARRGHRTDSPWPSGDTPTGCKAGGIPVLHSESDTSSDKDANGSDGAMSEASSDEDFSMLEVDAVMLKNYPITMVWGP